MILRAATRCGPIRCEVELVEEPRARYVWGVYDGKACVFSGHEPATRAGFDSAAARVAEEVERLRHVRRLGGHTTRAQEKGVKST